MKKIAIVLTAAAFVAVSLCSCKLITVNGEKLSELMKSSSIEASANIVSKEYTIGEFDRIVCIGGYDISFIPGDSYLMIEAPDNIIDSIKVECKDGTLSISTGKNRFRNANGIDIYVHSNVLNGLEVSGACDFDADEGIVSEDIDIKVSGAGEIDADWLKAKSVTIDIKGAGDIDIDNLACEGNLKVDISGAGDASFSGKAGSADIRISGAGNIDVRKLECKDVNTKISGAGRVQK